MLYGGMRYDPGKVKVELSTDLFVLDFSATTPRWLMATVDNMVIKGSFQLAFPNTGIAPLPSIGAVALMNREVGCRMHLASMTRGFNF
jgi:hypothetical protein